jgi:hypothetical protein
MLTESAPGVVVIGENGEPQGYLSLEVVSELL